MVDLSARCVLIAEDEFYLAKDLRETMKQSGARIMGPFPRTKAALEALSCERPDCAIIDVNLGEGADFELADALSGCGVPFLFFTGYDREVIPDRFSGVTRLEKPVDGGRLMREAAALCDKGLGGVD